MLLGDGRSHVTTLITLDATAAATWAAVRGLGPVDERLCADPALRAEIDTAVAAAKRAGLARQVVRRFRVVTRDFTIDGGYLTPSMKRRRAATGNLLGGCRCAVPNRDTGHLTSGTQPFRRPCDD